ncbi:MAG: universal stress protein [Anaerolineae bacterium]|nr:universal stress protein [Anaerolineae bacterium]
MKASNVRTNQSLILDNLVVDPSLARRLPPTIALQYHALPVAKDNGHITVAMATPEDQLARHAVASALDAELYAVQGDPAAIDELLTEIWSEETTQPLRLLVCDNAGPAAREVRAYARHLSDLLHAQLDFFQTDSPTNSTLAKLVGTAKHSHDLVIFGEPAQTPLKRMFLGPAGCGAAERLPTSVLIVRGPSWPLKRILLVTRGQSGVDDPAVDWLVRLAQPSKAAITVLALVPAMPAMYQKAMTAMPHGPNDWLTTDTPLGRQLRQIAQHVVNWEMQGKLRFRQGPPERQIRREAAAENYDLMIIAADPHDWVLRRLLGGLVKPLLRWTERPVLVAKSIIDK